MKRRPRIRQGEIRDWQPGDGLRCTYADKAPPLIPCGKPVKTAVQEIQASGRADFVKTNPLCANHSRAGWAPSDVMVAARKAATEQVISDHWDEFQDNIAKAVERLLAEAGEGDE